MWLLNAATQNLTAFNPDQVPAYCILSHTWSSNAADEVLFSDFETVGGERKLMPWAQLKPSWNKVELTCAQALLDGYDWAWIDTCCIDKSSSSELSEAINSMYTWYRNSAVCYAYLSDVTENVCQEVSRSEFRRSRWWTRGWTLQELLAPSKVVFFVGCEAGPRRNEEDRGRSTPTTRPTPICSRPTTPTPRRPIPISSRPTTPTPTPRRPVQIPSRPTTPAPEPAPTAAGWRSIGEKTDLSDEIASLTAIDIDILVDPELLGRASIAQRMSWASCRVTSRPEDMAYSLMGLFDVHMPMLYGEGGEKAFLRLQEEIMASSDDQTLFAWRDENASPHARYGLLATTPKFFKDSSRKVPYENWQCRPPYQITNRGLQVELPLREHKDQKGRYCAALDCPVPPDFNDNSFLAIYLEKLPGSTVQFARVMANEFAEEWNPGPTQQIYVRQEHKTAARPQNTGMYYPRHVFQMRKAAFLKGNYRVISLRVPDGAEVTDTLATQRGATHWLPDSHPQAFRIGKAPWAQCAGSILFEREEDGERLLVRIGSAGRAKVGFDAVRLLPKSRAGAGPEDPQVLQRQATEAFVPMHSGQSLVLRHHRVQVNFAAPQVYGSSMYILVDLEIEALSFAPLLPPPRSVSTWNTWDAVTLQGDDAVDTATVGSTQHFAPVKDFVKKSIPVWAWLRLPCISPRHRTPKVVEMRTLETPIAPYMVVRHQASAGTLREIARWGGED